MFLYYMRRLHREFVKTDYHSKYDFKGYWEWDVKGDYIKLPYYKHDFGFLDDSAIRYPYIDLEMCEVQDRVDAFREINLFMDLNHLVTKTTSIIQQGHGDDKNSMYISVWEDDTSDTSIVACFVLSKEKRSNSIYTFGYDHTPGCYLNARYCTELDDCNDKHPEPDSYYKVYVEATRGGSK